MGASGHRCLPSATPGKGSCEAEVVLMERCIQQFSEGLDRCPADSCVDTAVAYTRLLALDFELVLSTSKVTADDRAGQMMMLFGGQKRVDALRAFLMAVKHKDCFVVVVSWKSRKIITRALEAIGLLALVDAIYDEKALKVKGPWDSAKASLVKELLAQLDIKDDRAVFMDGDIGSSQGMPCARLCAESKKGMKQADMEAICALLRVPLAKPGVVKKV
mmetsp:Transcript_104813/g.224015  ORF Transcript_104813/g.224015 Transcript_104813/m.224015 type:complete len:218 (+) Transcript_104813:152-805(+)